MKPIKPGCKAVIVNTGDKDEGKIVTVIKRIDHYPGVLISGECWEVDTPLVYSNFAGDVKYFPVIEARSLKRIDDDDDEASWEQIEKATGRNPTKGKVT